MSDTTEVAQEWLASLRAKLEAERAELASQVAQLDADVRHESWKEPRSDDDAEAGSATFERERIMSLARHSRALLSEIEAALARMDAGTYGHCASCGQQIDPDRLEALPQATLCLDCRRQAERRRR